MANPTLVWRQLLLNVPDIDSLFLDGTEIVRLSLNDVHDQWMLTLGMHRDQEHRLWWMTPSRRLAHRMADRWVRARLDRLVAEVEQKNVALQRRRWVGFRG